MLKNVAPAALIALAINSTAPNEAVGGDREVHHICGLTGLVFCDDLRGVARAAGGILHSDGRGIAAGIIKRRPSHLMLSGHSLGCAQAFDIAAQIKPYKIEVAKVVCFDGPRVFATVEGIPANVRFVVSYRQDNPLDFGGARLCNGPVNKQGVCREQRGNTLIVEQTVNAAHVNVPSAVHGEAVAVLRP
jgi:hypothetical protein